MKISISEKDKEIKLFGVPVRVRSDTTLRINDNLQSCDQSDGFNRGVQTVVEQTSNASVQTVVGQTSNASVQTIVGQTNNESAQTNVRQGNLWSEEEHKSFLDGMEKLGRGDWKGIAAKFVPSRTPAQIASHAQKYFNRINKMKRPRTSVFDFPHSHMDQESHDVDEISSHPGSSANVASTSQTPPLAQENGPQQSSISSASPAKSRSFMAALCWISLEDYSSQSRAIHGYVVEPLQDVDLMQLLRDETNCDMNLEQQVPDEANCEMNLMQLLPDETNCDMNLEQQFPDETNCEMNLLQLLPDETNYDMNIQQVVPDETNFDMNIKQVLPDETDSDMNLMLLREMDCDLNLKTTVLPDEKNCDTNAEPVLLELMEMNSDSNLKTVLPDSMAFSETDS